MASLVGMLYGQLPVMIAEGDLPAILNNQLEEREVAIVCALVEERPASAVTEIGVSPMIQE